MTSDLTAVRSAMEGARNFSDQGYPLAIPTSVEASDGLTLTYKNGDATSYCVEAQTIKTGTVKYYVSSSDRSTPKEGSCPPLAIAVPSLATATVTGTQVQLGWNTIPGASSYEVQYRRNAGAWTSAAPAVTATNKTITGLILSSTYDFQVRTVVAGTASAWSPLVSRRTIPTPSITSATDLGCGNSGGSYAWLSASITWPATATTFTNAYRFETGGIYGYVPLTVANPTGTGSLTATTSTTQWQADGSGAGTVYLYGIGANGEKSLPATWTSPTHPPYDC